VQNLFCVALWSAKFILRGFDKTQFMKMLSITGILGPSQNKFGTKKRPQNKFGTKKRLQNKFGTKKRPQNKFGTKKRLQNKFGTKKQNKFFS